MAAAVQPVILSLGAVLSAFNLEELDTQPIEWKGWLPFAFKKSGYKKIEEMDEKDDAYEQVK